MTWFRRSLGWTLVVIGGLVLSALVLTALIEALGGSTKSTPLVAFLGFGAIFGIGPVFLGWVTLRKKPSATPVDITAIALEHLPSPEPASVQPPTELSVEVTVQQADVTHLHYWNFRKNWFIRVFGTGSILVLLSLVLNWQTIHWTGLQNLLFPAVVIGFAVLPWLNARIAFIRFHASTSTTRYTFSRSGYRSATPGLTADSSWDAVRVCWETTQAFVFFVRPPAQIFYLPEPMDAVIIPKRCFSTTEDERRLRALLGNVVGRRAVLRSPGPSTRP